MKKLILLSGALLTAAGLLAEGVVDGVLTLNDTADAGRTLVASLEARSLALADLASVTSLVVDCQGVVTGAEALNVADGTLWTGDLRIQNGSTFAVTAPNALGAASGTIFVEDGGQLKMAIAEKATWKQTKKTCYFAGEGPDGKGALYSTSAEHVVENCLWPYTLIMTGDARWSCTGSQADVYKGILDMNGHTLYYGVNGRFDGIMVTNAGHIVHTTHTMLIQGGCRFLGGPTNTLTVKRGARMKQWGSICSTPWTAIFEGDAGIDVNNKGCSWLGPVQLLGTVKLSRWVEYSTFTFYGPVSGVGGFQPNASNSIYSERINLCLKSAENTFQGGVTLRNGTVEVTANGALPPTGAALTLTDGTFLCSTTEACDLPAAIFCGTGMVVNGSGAWRGSVTKKGAGELVYTSRIGSDLLDVQGGRVRLGISDAGLSEGVYKGTSENLENTWNTTFPTNGTAAYPRYSYLTSSSGWSDLMYVAYSGYLWNRGTEDVTWTFASCIDDSVELKINDTTVLSGGGWVAPVFGTAVLHPGANRFTWRMLNWYGGAGGSAGLKASDGTYPWAVAKGLAYHVGATESKTPADYVAFTAADAGTLFTLSKDGAAEELAPFLPSFKTVRLAADTAFDLNGHSYESEAVEGVGEITNGTFTVTKRLGVTAADAVAGRHLLCRGALAFGPDAVIDVDNVATLAGANERVVAVAEDGVTGKPALSEALAAANWIVLCADNTVTLRRTGLTVILR